MKRKHFLLTILGMAAFMMVRANNTNPCNNGEKGKKVNEINGTVVSASTKKPVTNVNVTAYYTSKKEKVVISDSEGNYAFDDLKPGIYKFVFEKEGYKKVTKENVTVKVDETFLLNVELLESGGYNLHPSPLHFMDN